MTTSPFLAKLFRLYRPEELFSCLLDRRQVGAQRHRDQRQRPRPRGQQGHGRPGDLAGWPHPLRLRAEPADSGGGDGGRANRIVKIDIATGAFSQYALGEDVVVDGVMKHTLCIANDNDFLAVAPGGLANPNQLFVFAFDDADLTGSVYEPQKFKLSN
jgi:hypothetical protein